MKRKCGKCQSLKSLNLFPKNRLKSLGRGHYCKECAKEDILRYSRTEKGLISSIYNGQRRSSLYRGHQKPEYSKEELTAWILQQPNFKTLFNNWVSSDYTKDLKPSLDRVDDYKPYSFDNLKLVTWRENIENLSKNKKQGINNKQSKAVTQLDIKGNVIKNFYSIAQASREVGVNTKNIIYCCQNKPKYKTAKGFKWEYKNR